MKKEEELVKELADIREKINKHRANFHDWIDTRVAFSAAPPIVNLDYLLIQELTLSKALQEKGLDLMDRGSRYNIDDLSSKLDLTFDPIKGEFKAIFLGDVIKKIKIGAEPRYSVAELEKIWHNWDYSDLKYRLDIISDFMKFLKNQKKVEKILNGEGKEVTN